MFQKLSPLNSLQEHANISKGTTQYTTKLKQRLRGQARQVFK